MQNQSPESKGCGLAKFSVLARAWDARRWIKLQTRGLLADGICCLQFTRACTMYHVLCTMYYVLCTMYYVP